MQSTTSFHYCASQSTLLLLGVFMVLGPSVSVGFFQSSRTWKDATGKFEIEAEFVRIDGEKVVLRKTDGSNVSVPINKLSAIDQGYIEGRRSAGGSSDDNPFKEMEPDSSASDSNSQSTAGGGTGSTPRTLQVDFTKCHETTIAVGQWDPDVEQQPAMPLKLKNVALKKKNDFWEKYAQTAYNVKAKRAVITHHLGRRGQEQSTRLELVDLESGQIVANATGQGHWTALAIDDDGQNIVVQDVSDMDKTGRQLGTVQLKGKKIIPVDLWKPYEAMSEPAKEQVVRFARFINGGKLLTLSQSGQVVIWDFASRRPVRRFSYHGACQPALTHDRKHLAICGGDIFGIVNLENKSATPSVVKAPLMNYFLHSSFSPSCKRFAAATTHKLMVWDVESGQVLFEGKIPGISTGGSLHFPHEDFVVVNNDKMVEFSSGIKLWRYHGAAITSVHGQTVFVHADRDGAKMMPIAIPHSAAQDLLDKAKKQSDLFVLKKGSKVALDLSGVPRHVRSDVEQSLKDNLDKKGFTYAQNAPVRLKAEITGPTTEAVSYHFAGSFVVKQYVSKLNLEYEGNSLWAASGNNVPGAVSGGDKNAIKQQLDKAGQKPNIGFFGSAQLPDYLQKPTGDANNRDAQMLGSSQVGLNGIN